MMSAKPKIVINKVKKTPTTPRTKKVEEYSWVEGGRSDYDVEGEKYILPNVTEFPDYILEKYGEYQLRESNVWDCKNMSDMSEMDLFLYQKFISQYLLFHSPYRGILLYYGLGAGKTRAAIEIAREYRAYGHEIVFISPAALVDNYLGELGKWGAVSTYIIDEISKMETRKTKLARLAGLGFRLVSYNASNKLAQLKDVLDPQGNNPTKITDKLIIIEEVHNFVQFLHNGLNSVNSTRRHGAQQFYDLLLTAQNCRFICLSGTPMINNPNEMAVLFNILRGPLRFRKASTPTNKQQLLPDRVQKDPDTYEVFPVIASDFDRMFVDWEKLELRAGMDKVFKQRIMGLVSFYSGAKGKVYPDILDQDGNAATDKVEPWILHKVEMSSYQLVEYKAMREQETQLEEAKKSNKTKQITNKEEIASYVAQNEEEINSTFRIKSRQIGNFSLPDSLRKFRPSSIIEEPEKLTSLYTAFSNDLMNGEKSIFSTAPTEGEYGSNLAKYSPKMLEMLDTIESDRFTENDGNVLVYSNFRSIEGIEIFANILTANGYEWYNPTTPDPNLPHGERFAILGTDHRIGDKDMTTEILKVFNSPENTNGETIKIVLGTSNIAEGISLFNIRKVLIMEPHWNMVKINQVIGRARRICSHKNLPYDKWNFKVHFFISVIPEGGSALTQDKISTDETIYEIARRKETVKTKFIKLIKEAAVDCVLNATHNENRKYGIDCLRFPPTERITYTYFPNINDDIAYGTFGTKDESVEVSAVRFTPPEMFKDNQKLWEKYVDPGTKLVRFSILVDSTSPHGEQIVSVYLNADPKKTEILGKALYDRNAMESSGELVLKGYLLVGKAPWPLTSKGDVTVVREYYQK